MRKTILIICFILPYSVRYTCAQTGSVFGVVTDSLTGQPVVNLTVFIPNTTVGTTTDQNGNYRIDKINPGEYKLMFRHLSYLAVSRSITIEPGKEAVLNILLAEAPQYINEVTVVGRRPDRGAAYQLVKQYFLGDVSEYLCKLENPEVLNYHFDGKILKATAKEPLIIINRHLGYRITFFLDYFQCTYDTDSQFDYDFSGNFGYSGYALFEDLMAVQPIMAMVWKINRKSEFRGTLRHFLACLYSNELNNYQYTLKRAYIDSDEIQRAGKLSKAMTKVRMAQMDSIAFWNHVKGKPEILFFDPVEVYTFSGEEIRPGPELDTRAITCSSFLLVIRDSKKTGKVSEAFVSTLRIPKGGITFDQDGNLRAAGGELQWVNLDNNMQLKRMLPNDYLKKN